MSLLPSVHWNWNPKCRVTTASAMDLNAMYLSNPTRAPQMKKIRIKVPLVRMFRTCVNNCGQGHFSRHTLNLIKCKLQICSSAFRLKWNTLHNKRSAMSLWCVYTVRHRDRHRDRDRYKYRWIHTKSSGNLCWCVCLFSMNTSTQFLPIFIGLCIWQCEHTVNMLKQQRNYECHHTIKAILRVIS